MWMSICSLLLNNIYLDSTSFSLWFSSSSPALAWVCPGVARVAGCRMWAQGRSLYHDTLEGQEEIQISVSDKIYPLLLVTNLINKK